MWIANVVECFTYVVMSSLYFVKKIVISSSSLTDGDVQLTSRDVDFKYHEVLFIPYDVVLKFRL